jgi:ketosteroid isomerase-like protein
MKPYRIRIVRRALLLSLAAWTVAACTTTAPPGPANVGEVVALLTAQADRWDKAIVRKDRAAIEANMAEDFRQIDAQGNVETKAVFVEGLLSPELVIDPYTVEDFDVRLYGDVALLSGRTRMTGRYQGRPFASHYRYIDIYVRRGGAWKIVSVQISRIPG